MATLAVTLKLIVTKEETPAPATAPALALVPAPAQLHSDTGRSGPVGPEMQFMLITVPANVRPGEQMVVMTPQGQEYMVIVPQGAEPGTQFQTAFPRTESHMGHAPAPQPKSMDLMKDLQHKAQTEPTKPENIALFVKNLGSDRVGVRDAALSGLEKAVAIEREALSCSQDRLVTLVMRKGEGIAACGLQAVALLAPSVLEEVVPKLIKKWQGTNDEAAVKKFWQLLDKLPVGILQQNAAEIRKRLPAISYTPPDGLLQKLNGEGDKMAVEVQDDGRVAFDLTVRCTDDDGDEQRVWLGECVSNDPTYHDFTHRFAEDPSQAEDHVALMSALKDTFTDSHPGLQLVEDTPPTQELQGENVVFHFRAKVQPVEKVHKELPEMKRQVSAEAPQDDIYPAQWLMALELAERIRRLYGTEWSGLYDKFQKVDFIIFTANLHTVADQTLRRVEGRGVCGNDADKAARRVVRYTKPRDNAVVPEFTLFKQRVEKNPRTLFIIIADECHWGVLQDKPHDRYVNDPSLCKAENVVVLLVSATPYCLLTADSRLPEKKVSVGEQQLDVHCCSWQDVVVRQRRFVNDDDVEWLEAELRGRSTEPQSINLVERLKACSDPAGLTYQSLDSVYLNPNEKLVRPDPTFEGLMRRKELQDVKAGKVLAVDYAFRMLRYCDDWEQHVKWLAEDTPVTYGYREVVKQYLVAHGKAPTAEGAKELITRWQQAQAESTRTSFDGSLETDEIVSQLLSPDKIRMQVLRVSDTAVGEKILSFLSSVRRRLGLEAQFELLGDFKDLNIKKEMDQQWFESLQRTHRGWPIACQHRVGASRKPCDKGPDGRPCEEYQPSGKDKKCANCGHAHVNICSYGDLRNRSLLLILVAKGRLGDTFPHTFHCLDMRARYRTDQPSSMMSTLVQELGRLCRHSKEGEDRPYALVSEALYKDAMPPPGLTGNRLAWLLREHGSRLDSHMTLEYSETWDKQASQCQSIDELAALMRQCCKARDGRDVAVRDEDGASGGSKVICYDAGNRSKSKAERYHQRRVLLFAEPQIGKTGSFLGLIEVLRLRLTPQPEEIQLDDISDDEEEGDVPGGRYPVYARMQAADFQHTGGKSGTPRNGKYGDPAFDKLWDHFISGGKGQDADEEMLAGGRGTTGGKKKVTTAAVPKQEQAGPTLPSSQVASGGKEKVIDICNQIRYKTGAFDAGKAKAAQAAAAHKEHIIQFQGDVKGKLHLAADSFDSWELSEAEPRLTIDESDEERVLFPILMPSSGRAVSARLDLSGAMQGRPYVQIVCVKGTEIQEYLEAWPGLCFFELPGSASDLGIGASRYWMLQLARKICPDEFRFFFMMDDNVQAWKACPLEADNSVFEGLPYPLERFRDNRTGQKKDVPLCEVLAHFQADEFRDELLKFGMIGFDRLGRREVAIVNPFARRHVYKAIIFNLNVISDANYKPIVRVWEDIEFNLRVSGRERQEGGGSSRMERSVAVSQSGGGVWIDQETKSKDMQLILDEDNPPGPAVICKCYHFAYYQDQAIAKKGGCRADQLHEEGDDEEEQNETGGEGSTGGGNADDPSLRITQRVEKCEKELGVLEQELEELKQEHQEAEAVDIEEKDFDLCVEIENKKEGKSFEVQKKRAELKQLKADAEAASAEAEARRAAEEARRAAEKQLKRKREERVKVMAELKSVDQLRKAETTDGGKRDRTEEAKELQGRAKRLKQEIHELEHDSTRGHAGPS